ncbi:MAG TPA: peptidylprolyl isomerase [Dehalococcoidia bacterium]
MYKFGYMALIATVLIGVVVAGCSSAPAATAKDGDVVQVNYTGTLADGTVFDSSVGRTPLEFTVGAGQVIPGFENAMLGMKVGEKKTVNIPAAEAYGPRLDNMEIQVSRDRIKTVEELAVGQVLTTVGANGEQYQFTVMAISDNGTITLDGNHPLAGKDLTFEIELLKLN